MADAAGDAAAVDSIQEVLVIVNYIPDSWSEQRFREEFSRLVLAIVASRNCLKLNICPAMRAGARLSCTNSRLRTTPPVQLARALK